MGASLKSSFNGLNFPFYLARYIQNKIEAAEGSTHHYLAGNSHQIGKLSRKHTWVLPSVTSSTGHSVCLTILHVWKFQYNYSFTHEGSSGIKVKMRIDSGSSHCGCCCCCYDAIIMTIKRNKRNVVKRMNLKFPHAGSR